MADKLNEAAWTGFTKKHKLALDDKALLKALAAVDKAAGGDAAAQRAPLDALIEQIGKQVLQLAKLRKALGDKTFGLAKDKLYELLETAEAQQKVAAAAPAAKAAGAAASAEEDEEPSSPALLTTKMLPLIRQLRGGDVRMPAMVCTAGRNTAVLIMRRPIATTRRKLLAEAVDAAGGARYSVGDCAFEDGALTFTLQAKVSGLAKRLRAALLAQTGLRLRVRVRGDDGIEEDGEDGDAATGAPASGAGAATATDAPDAAAAFKARLAAAVAALQAVAAVAQAQEIKLQLSEAGTHFRAGRVQEAEALLAEAERRLAGAAAPAPGAAAGAAGAAAKAGAAATEGASGMVAFTKTRLAWDGTRKKVQAELRKLEQAILAQCAAFPDAAEIAAGTRGLYRILDHLDERLIDTLDEALNAAEPAERQRLHRQAHQIVDEYMAYVQSEPLFADIDDNGFLPVAIASTLNTALGAMARQLRAVATA